MRKKSISEAILPLAFSVWKSCIRPQISFASEIQITIFVYFGWQKMLQFHLHVLGYFYYLCYLLYQRTKTLIRKSQIKKLHGLATKHWVTAYNNFQDSSWKEVSVQVPSTKPFIKAYSSVSWPSLTCMTFKRSCKEIQTNFWLHIFAMFEYNAKSIIWWTI